MADKTIKTILEAAAGTRLQLLEALRDKVAGQLDSPKISNRDMASLSLRILEITAEIDKVKLLEDPAGSVVGSDTDEDFLLEAV